MEQRPFEFAYFIPNDHGDPIPLWISGNAYLGICRAIIRLAKVQPDLPAYMQDPTKKPSPELLEILALMYVGAAVCKLEPLTTPEESRIEHLLERVYKQALEEKWRDDADPILSMCYHLLASKQITREQAVRYAIDALGSKAIQSPDAWRKRVDRWAASRHLPPIGQPKRSKRTSQIR